jgi:hypothetical protein
LPLIFDLIFKLYTEEYLGFIERSEVYVDKIINFISINITTFPAKPKPIKLKHLGKNIFFINLISAPRGISF